MTTDEGIVGSDDDKDSVKEVVKEKHQDVIDDNMEEESEAVE